MFFVFLLLVVEQEHFFFFFVQQEEHDRFFSSIDIVGGNKGGLPIDFFGSKFFSNIFFLLFFISVC